MCYACSDKLTPDEKKARFDRLEKRGCQREVYERDAEQQAEAAATLLDMSVSSQPSEPDVGIEPINNEDASCPDTGIHDGCISQTAKLPADNQRTMTELEGCNMRMGR